MIRALVVVTDVFIRINMVDGVVLAVVKFAFFPLALLDLVQVGANKAELRC